MYEKAWKDAKTGIVEVYGLGVRAKGRPVYKYFFKRLPFMCRSEEDVSLFTGEIKMAYAHKDLTKEECMGLYNELKRMFHYLLER